MYYRSAFQPKPENYPRCPAVDYSADVQVCPNSLSCVGKGPFSNENRTREPTHPRRALYFIASA